MKKKMLIGICSLALVLGAVAIPVFAASNMNAPTVCETVGTADGTIPACCEQQLACCK